MNKKKVKVYFILPTLFAGGAERIISFVSQQMDKTKFNVTLIIIGYEKDSKYDIQGIPVSYLDKDRVLDSVFSLIKLIRKDKPDIVVSSISHLNIMMGLISVLFPKIKFVARQATINKVVKKFKKTQNKSIFRNVFKIDDFAIKRLDKIICQSHDMKTDFLESHNIKESKIKVIQNPITFSNTLKTKSKPHDFVKLITIGRFSKIKGQLRLLDILEKLDIPFTYTLIGTGSLEDEIFNKIDAYNLRSKINYIPHTYDVGTYLQDHDYFLQGSYSEGFPNALLESCVVGTPVIAFNVPGGTKEIVEDGVNGYLVNDEAEFLQRLKNTKTWNPEIVRASVLKKFSKEKIIGQYEQLFIDILK